MDATYLLTDHAIDQMDARLIGREVLELLLANGDRHVHVGGGMRALSITRQRLRTLRHSGVAAAIIERAAKVVAVLKAANDPADERPVVITVMRARGGEASRYRRYRGRA